MSPSKRKKLCCLFISFHSLRASKLVLVSSQDCPLTTIYSLVLLSRYAGFSLSYFCTFLLNFEASTRSS